MTPKRCDTCVYWHLGEKVQSPSGAILPPEHTMAPQDDCRATGSCLIGPPERDRDTDRGRWPLTLADEYCHAHFPKEAAP